MASRKDTPLNSSLIRPEQQKEMLKLCASCTRVDVALNNLVVRARTPAQHHSAVSILDLRRTIKAVKGVSGGKAKATSSRSPKGPGGNNSGKTKPARKVTKPKKAGKAKPKAKAAETEK